MISIDKFKEQVQLAADELPDCFFDGLNGGLAVLRRAKRHPKGADGDLYILGEYVSDPAMGKVIYLYYGSFRALYGHLGEDELFLHVRGTVRHEFRHHLESRGGERGLEIEDALWLEEYLSEKDGRG